MYSCVICWGRLPHTSMHFLKPSAASSREPSAAYPWQGRYCVPRRTGDEERAPPPRNREPLTFVREKVSLNTGEVARASSAQGLPPLCCRTACSRSAPSPMLGEPSSTENTTQGRTNPSVHTHLECRGDSGVCRGALAPKPRCS